MSELEFPPAETMTLQDGRTLCYAVFGDRSAAARHTVFYHHGFPGSRLEAGTGNWDAVARRRSVRLVSVDRPGMGGSTHKYGRTLLDWPTDLLALADHLMLKDEKEEREEGTQKKKAAKNPKFAVLGISGGAPYTLACWHALPRSRCAAAAVVAGLYPHALGLQDLPLPGQTIMRLGAWSPWAGARLMDAVALGAATQERLVGVAGRGGVLGTLARAVVGDGDTSETPGMAGLTPADAAVWRADPRLRATLMASTREALRNGGDGAAWDAAAYADWGFGLEELDVGGGKGEGEGDDGKSKKGKGRVVFWHGNDDANVPVSMAQRAAALLPDAEFRFSENEGHISLITHKADEVLETLCRMLDEDAES